MNAASTLRSRLRLLREQARHDVQRQPGQQHGQVDPSAPLTRGRASTVPLCSTLRSVACVVRAAGRRTGTRRRFAPSEVV